MIKQVIKKGHTVIIATGRPYQMTKDYYQQLGLTTPLITFNGALTHIPGKKWSGERAVSLDRRYLHELLDQQERFELDFIASEYREEFYITMDRPEAIDPSIFGLNELSEDLRLTREKITADPLALLVQTRHKDKYQLAKDIKTYFNQELEVDSWGGLKNILEFAAKGINKATALDHLLTQLGLSQKDLIAFGDEQNDTEMLAFAETSYAMKNANPILLEYADHQLPWTCNEDGVAKQLKRLFLDD